MNRVRNLIASGTILISVLLAATGCNGAEERALVRDLVNNSRAEYHKLPLAADSSLDAKAQNWAAYLASTCQLKHSSLAEGAPPQWARLGENVGYGGTIEQVHSAYMNSPGHRANILDGGFQYIGTGVAYGDCFGSDLVFTVQVFMQT